ncbi:MAG: hypothetical protein AAF639_17210, partial [Chloroflexota bacterium]
LHWFNYFCVRPSPFKVTVVSQKQVVFGVTPKHLFFLIYQKNLLHQFLNERKELFTLAVYIGVGETPMMTCRSGVSLSDKTKECTLSASVHSLSQQDIKYKEVLCQEIAQNKGHDETDDRQEKLFTCRSQYSCHLNYQSDKANCVFWEKSPRGHKIK